ncbi:transcriptional regulator PpsR [soil metagenome]
MNANAATALSGRKAFPRGLSGDVDGSVAEMVAAAAGDIALIIDREGVIRDLAVTADDLVRDGAESWLDRRWQDTVTVDSKIKVEELLRDARKGSTRWREVNQLTTRRDSAMVRYVVVDARRDGHLIAIGRDERATSVLQQRLVEAQQAIERDYSRLRDAEGRYRLLFRLSGEAVLVVDASSRRIIEANPEAERLLGRTQADLVGETFSRVFDADSQDEAASLIAVARSTGRASPSQTRLFGRHQPLLASASLFRQDRASLCLIRLTRADRESGAAEAAGPDLSEVVERIPDAFLVTDATMNILTANAAFLDMVRIGTAEQARGQSLARLLGRAGLERNLLLDSLREHGSVRNFRTVLRNDYGDQEDVEVSGAAVPDGDDTVYGFTIRTIERRVNDRPQAAPELRRSVERLTELVGRSTLKDLVRETTDLVERLCIEAALELTKNNRASAADVLGLSRQSLYSKLHRFGIGNLSPQEH